MKKSKEKTGYILVRANITSEWDNCDSALISYDESTLEKWKMRDAMANAIKGSSDFLCITFFDSAEFLNLNTKIVEGTQKSPYMVYVEMKEDYDFKKKQLPEQQIDCHQMKFYGNGQVQFTAWGKYTPEEFCTESINLNDF